MSASAAAPEREPRLRSRPSDNRLLSPSEGKRVKKGMSRRAKVLLASGLALGAAAVGGVVAKQRFDALAPLDQLDVANRMVRGTDWFPWLSGRIRSMRDAGIMRGLNSPDTNLTMLQKAELANRVLATPDVAPEVRAAVAAKRDAAVRQGVTDFSDNARTWLRSFGSSLNGGGMKTPVPSPEPLPMPKVDTAPKTDPMPKVDTAPKTDPMPMPRPRRLQPGDK